MKRFLIEFLSGSRSTAPHAGVGNLPMLGKIA